MGGGGGGGVGASLCDQCDLAALDDARHLILQCPKWQNESGIKPREIAAIQDGSGLMVIYCMC